MGDYDQDVNSLSLNRGHICWIKIDGLKLICNIIRYKNKNLNKFYSMLDGAKEDLSLYHV